MRTVRHSASLSDNALEWIGVILGLTAIMVFDKRGMPQKWHAAVMWTLCTFGPFLVISRRRWRFWNFWTAWAICLGFHVCAMCVIFARIFARIEVLGMLYVVPLGFLEFIFLLPIIPKVERKLAKG